MQAVMAAGALTGIGVITTITALTSNPPDLGAAFQAMAPRETPTRPAPTSLPGRVGLWSTTRVRWLAPRVPEADFNILGLDRETHLGRKILMAGYGLSLPLLVVAVLNLVGGFTIPWGTPLVVGVVIGAVFLPIPDGAVRDRAVTARADFVRALGAFTDLVAVERANGAGVAAAMETAAATTNNWVFTRLQETLATSRWSGQTPWDGLTELADRIGVAQLGELANIMRMAGEQTTTIAETLRTRSAALRNAIAENEHAAANAAGERMWIAASLLAVVYLVMLAAPGMLRLITS
jgi:pilus assembly protein TadC